MSLTKHSLALGRVAGGDHLSAAQDEPEPVLGEMEAVEADLARNVNKGAVLAARNDAHALAVQVLNLDAMRRAGW